MTADNFAITVDVVITSDDLAPRRGFAQPHRPKRAYGDFGPFVFRRNYARAVREAAAISPAVVARDALVLTLGTSTAGLRVCQDRRMLVRERPVVVAVCGCPGAGKTTIASATAGRLGIPFLTRDEIKTGLGLSSASVAEDGRVRLDRDFHVAGGPVSLRAEAVMVDAIRLLAASGVSFVVESSVLSRELLGVLLACGTRVLAVHVVAEEAVIGRRLGARAAAGGAIDQQLLSLFQRGEMKRSIFEPPEGVDAVVEIDTSHHGTRAIETIVAAVVALLDPSRTGGGSSPIKPATNHRPEPAGDWRPGQSVESLRRS